MGFNLSVPVQVYTSHCCGQWGDYKNPLLSNTKNFDIHFGVERYSGTDDMQCYKMDKRVSSDHCKRGFSHTDQHLGHNYVERAHQRVSQHLAYSQRRQLECPVRTELR